MNNTLKMDRQREQKFIVSDVESRYKVDLDERLIDLSVSVIRFLQNLPKGREFDVFRY